MILYKVGFIPPQDKIVVLNDLHAELVSHFCMWNTYIYSDTIQRVSILNIFLLEVFIKNCLCQKSWFWVKIKHDKLLKPSLEKGTKD